MARTISSLGANMMRVDPHLVDVLGGEHGAINDRRASLRARNRRVQQDVAEIAPGAGGPNVYEVSGLALSGGGIRSAAFSLGAMQALEQHFGIDRIDYLSTVSGGGYIGSSLTAAMATTGDFPYGKLNDFNDPPALGHLRNYSNYLLPRGETMALPRSLSVVFRGLVVNVVMTGAAMLTMVLLTVLAYPSRDVLEKGSFIPRLIARPFDVTSFELFGVTLMQRPFELSLAVLAALAIYLAGWAVVRSFQARADADVEGPGVSIPAWTLLALLTVLFLDLQPFMLAHLWRWQDALLKGGGLLHWLSGRLALLTVPTGVGAVLSLFASRMATFLKVTERSAGTGTVAARVAAKAALFLVALFVPVLIWLAYLRLCELGIAPQAGDSARLGLWFFGVGAVALWGVTALYQPNGNSLHSLYRGRLSKAFLFDPTPPKTPGAEFNPLDKFKLHQASPPNGGPYHLINAALNIQGSRHSNMRGRNADFFLFSRLFVGSAPTGYVATKAMEASDKRLDLGTAMAVSGAAASSDMGAMTIKALAPTLALLNIRLGYWLPNPKIMRPKAWRNRLQRVFNFYLIVEMLGLLDENHPDIYLTDGGHIENLGLYQLLKRGCSFIVVVDAEADREYGFASLMALERYARIDLGVRIDLPWQDIALSSIQLNQAAGSPMPITHQHGPHCALGRIHYPNGTDGTLLYVKASLTGDENDYILDYKRRNPDFPHETTGDQFYTEEQLEVYRALGYHALEGALTGQSAVAWEPELGEPNAFDLLQAIRGRFA